MKTASFIVLALSCYAANASASLACAGAMAGTIGASCSSYSKPHWLSGNFDGGYDTYYSCSNGEGMRLSYSSGGACQSAFTWAMD